MTAGPVTLTRPCCITAPWPVCISLHQCIIIISCSQISRPVDNDIVRTERGLFIVENLVSMHHARHKVLGAYRLPSLLPAVSYFAHMSVALAGGLYGIGTPASAIMP